MSKLYKTLSYVSKRALTCNWRAVYNSLHDSLNGVQDVLYFITCYAVEVFKAVTACDSSRVASSW